MAYQYGIIPLIAAQRSHELSPKEWKLYTYYLARHNLITRQCNPSHGLISRECKINQTSVSTLKKKLEGKKWIKRTGKYSVKLLVGAEVLEQARAEAIEKIAAEEAAQFGRRQPQDTGPSFEKVKATADAGGAENVASFEKVKARRRKRRHPDRASFELFKGSGDEAQKNQRPALNNSKPIEQEKEEQEKKAAAAAPPAADSNAWKKEAVTQAFIDDLIKSGMHSKEVVDASWRELAFAVAQRGPDARATKGELLGFCRAKERTLNLPGYEMPADVANMRVARPPQSAPAPANINCDSSCELCGGCQFQVIPGKGAQRCPNRVARREAAKKEGGA
jgi:ribosomal protein L18